MRIEQTFTVKRSPEDVFWFMTDPDNLMSWQPSKLKVEALTDGPPRQGYRVKERTKIGPRTWDQVVEFTEFEPGRVFVTHIVEGAMPVDGRWTFEPDGPDGSRITFVAEGEVTGALRLLEPMFKRSVARSFRHYHELLAAQVEASPATVRE